MPALSPSTALPSVSTAHSAIGRALASAATVGGVMAVLPCHFHVLPSESEGQWIIVACRPPRDAAHAPFVHERSLTAVQRFTLSLWSDGIAAVWEPAPVPADALAGLDLGPDTPIGRVWCPSAL